MRWLCKWIFSLWELIISRLKLTGQAAHIFEFLWIWWFQFPHKFFFSTVNPHTKPKISNLTSTKLLLNSFSWFYTNPVFKDYRETTLFISMDYSYNPTSEPLHLVWLTWWVLHLIISGLYSIPLSLFKE